MPFVIKLFFVVLGNIMINFPNKTSKFMDVIDLNHHMIKAAELKVFWDPNLTKIRSNGQFKMTVIDIVNKYKHIKFPTDVKTIPYKNQEIDKGML